MTNAHRTMARELLAMKIFDQIDLADLDVHATAAELVAAAEQGASDIITALEALGVVVKDRAFVQKRFSVWAAENGLAPARGDIDAMGGWPALVEAARPAAVAAGVAQRRLSRFLEQQGAPGEYRFDPFQRTLSLRGHTFPAELVGTFGGGYWLWAWANPHLSLSEEMVTIAKATCAGFSHPSAEQPSIQLSAVPPAEAMHTFGRLAVGHGGAGAYYICNNSQVYALCAGQLSPENTLADLHFSLVESLMTGPLPAEACATAAQMLGLAVAAGEGRLVISAPGEDDPLIVVLTDGMVSRLELTL